MLCTDRSSHYTNLKISIKLSTDYNYIIIDVNSVSFVSNDLQCQLDQKCKCNVLIRIDVSI